MSDHISIDSLYQTDCLRENDTIAQIKAGNNIEGQITGLWYYNQTFFLHHLKYKKYDELKLDAYHCAHLDEFLITHYESRVLDYGINHFTYALLSDNNELINRYARLSHPWYSFTIKKGSLTHAIQNIVKEDWESLKEDIAIYSKLVLSQKGKVNIPDLTFFNGILNKDTAQIKEGIILLLKDHKKRNKHMGIAQEYISIPALTYSKLAWLKGFEIEVDHPLIPRELLPHRPLETYENKYDFLKG